MMKIVLNGGRLTGLGVLLAVVIGGAFAYISLSFFPTKFGKLLGLSIGLVIMGVGAYSARATALGLPPPFTNDPLGWRKAKETYKTEAAAEEITKNDDKS
jgi:hypothetical protein